jgi:hypothetical protein
LSCGCLRKEKLITRNIGRYTGRKAHPLYETWRSMIRRCTEPTHASFQDYGARGIVVCERWAESFEAFLEDMGPCPDGMTLDRRESAGNYEPGNCRWATAIEQSNNRSNVRKIEMDGRRLSLAEACRLTGVKYATAAGRVRRGWSAARAVSQPVRS